MPTPDEKAAHEFLTELRTRIATQSLPYQYGVEERALTSLWEIFGLARKAIKDNPGCEKFAGRTIDVLNTTVRPLTAKWHRAKEKGVLDSRDGADAFRSDLRIVQAQLRKFADELHQMAYHSVLFESPEPPVMGDFDLAELFVPLKFGIIEPDSIPNAAYADIRRDEAQAVQERRAHCGLRKDPDIDGIGLALSGGGIRSASFGLGVVQVLAAKKLLKEVDFLSTVSGGGYTGSFLTRRLGAHEAHDTVAAPQGPDPEPIRYLRLHARYLSGRNLGERWSMVCATLGGMLLNWATPVFIVLVAALLGVGLGWTREGSMEVKTIVLGCMACLSAIAMVVFGVGMRGGRRCSAITGWLFGLVLAGTGIFGLIVLFDASYISALKKITDGKPLNTLTPAMAWTAAIGLLSSAIPSLIRHLPVLRDPKNRQLVLKVALFAAGILIPCLGIILFYVLVTLALPPGQPLNGGVVIALAVAAVTIGLIAFFVVDINLTAPHRMYRDALARTFIQKEPNETEAVKLATINPENTAPYHLLNAALNIPSSETAGLNERACDFFLFSKKWCGSPSSGYVPTGEWKTPTGDLDLATAMAVSGAAFSSHMGLGSMPTLTALLTVLNVRLGYWIKHPRRSTASPWPGFWCLFRETFGVVMNEHRTWLNLSDGGHIENMAVYELLRRRCKFIVCVDGESDPTFTFQGLMTLVRHARIDFGVTISPALDDLRPDPKTGYSKAHFHLCRIHYPPVNGQDATGLLLYLKLSVTGNESELIRRYRTNHPEFPHQTTLDQFFDQEQFEAYRQLGVHVAESLFKPALLNGEKQPASISEWFRRLSANLLVPLKGS